MAFSANSPSLLDWLKQKWLSTVKVKWLGDLKLLIDCESKNEQRLFIGQQIYIEGLLANHKI